MKLQRHTSDIVRNSVLLAILIALGILLTITIGLFKGGFKDFDNFKMFVFYAILPIGSAIIIILMVVVNNILFKNSEYGTGVCFNSPNENPAILGKYFKFFRNPINLLLISVLIFSLLGLYIAFTKQTFVGIGEFKEQFTKGDKIAFQTGLVTIGENLGVAAWFALAIYGLRLLSKRKNFGELNFNLLSWLAMIIIYFLYGVLNHMSVAGSSEVAILNHAGFWVMGGFLTILTGSFIPFLILHICNNLFYDLSTLFSSEIAIVFGIIFIIVSAILLFISISITKKQQQTDVIQV